MIANEFKWFSIWASKCTIYFKQYLMCVYLFIIAKVWSLFRDFILLFLREKSGKTQGKPTGKIQFSRLRVRNVSLADLRMRICYQNNGGSNISKRENSELWRDYFRNCAPVSLGEQRILIK
jgi:hypothetical protein